MEKKKPDLRRISLTVLFFTVFFLAFFVMRKVPLMGDDLFYHTFTELSPEAFWQEHLAHYKEANGRAIVHILVTLFLLMPPLVWQVVNALFVAAILTMAAALLPTEAERTALLPVLLGALFFVALKPDLTRETLYWLTGSFNYVYPLVLLFALFHVLYKKDLPKRRVLLPLLAFFAAATMEQTAMMTLGLLVLYLLDAWLLQKKRPAFVEILAGVLALCGALSVFVAPATFVRYTLETDVGFLETFKNQLPLIVYWLLTRSYTVPFVLLFFATSGVFLLCHRKDGKPFWLFPLAALGDGVGILCVLRLSKTLSSVFTPEILVGAGLAVTACLFSSVCILWLLLTRRPKGYGTAATALILAGGSQIMMAASPVFGARNLFFGVCMLFFFTAHLIVYSFDTKPRRILWTALLLVLLLIALPNYVRTYQGYQTNFAIAQQNEARIEAYLSTPTEVLTLEKNKYEECAWSPPYGSDYHLWYYKRHYHLPADTVIQWVDP